MQGFGELWSLQTPPFAHTPKSCAICAENWDPAQRLSALVTFSYAKAWPLCSPSRTLLRTQHVQELVHEPPAPTPTLLVAFPSNLVFFFLPHPPDVPHCFSLFLFSNHRLELPLRPSLGRRKRQTEAGVALISLSPDARFLPLVGMVV